MPQWFGELGSTPYTFYWAPWRHAQHVCRPSFGMKLGDSRRDMTMGLLNLQNNCLSALQWQGHLTQQTWERIKDKGLLTNPSEAMCWISVCPKLNLHFNQPILRAWHYQYIEGLFREIHFSDKDWRNMFKSSKNYITLIYHITCVNRNICTNFNHYKGVVNLDQSESHTNLIMTMLPAG